MEQQVHHHSSDCAAPVCTVDFLHVSARCAESLKFLLSHILLVQLRSTPHGGVLRTHPSSWLSATCTYAWQRHIGMTVSSHVSPSVLKGGPGAQYQSSKLPLWRVNLQPAKPIVVSMTNPIWRSAEQLALMLVTEQSIRGCDIWHCAHIEADAAQARASPQLLVRARLPAMNGYSGQPANSGTLSYRR